MKLFYDPFSRRLAIAELCGWNPQTCLVDSGYLVSHDEEVQGWMSPTGKIAASVYELPDYENDLNACAEMEPTLSDDRYRTYSKHLVWIVERDCWRDDVEPTSLFPRTHSATAAQRCEAFLRTFEKWEP